MIFFFAKKVKVNSFLREIVDDTHHKNSAKKEDRSFFMNTFLYEIL